MSNYTPDVWVVLEIKRGSNEPIYKVLAGWYGGYLHGDSWKLNSGITKIKKDGNNYIFSGYSGSTYECHKSSERMSGLTASIFSAWVEEVEGTDMEIKVVPLKSIIKRFKESDK